MKFFKTLFTKKIKEELEENATGANFEGVGSTEDFKERYEEEAMPAATLDGCLKMIESYFHDAKVNRDTKLPINHPQTLDATIQDGMGFELYCTAFDFDRGQVAMFLAYAFSDFLINKYDFKLYKDSAPEYPLRGMTLKYDKQGMFLSIYPFEYAVKALDHEGKFIDLLQKIDANVGQIDNIKDKFDEFINP